MSSVIIQIMKYLILFGIACGLIAVGYYYYRLSLRPELINYEEKLWQGINYRRVVIKNPQLASVHIVEIDLNAKDIHFLVSPPDNLVKFDLNAQTTSHFLEKYNLQVAINGSFFAPFHSHGPLDYYPHEGDPVDVLGLAISSGKTYSSDYPDWAVFCATKNHVSISKAGCDKDTQQAIAGKELVVKQGQLNTAQLKGKYAKGTYPRTAIAVNKEETKVWFVVVDGRQKKYSEGISLDGLSNLLISLGAYNAINLDGGGSSTLVTQQGGKAKLLSAPFHTKIPMNERPVANHLGVYALPL